MEPVRRNGCRKSRRGACAAGALAVLLLAACLLIALPSFAVTDNDGGATFEDRAAAEKLSRSRYRDLEVASLIVILIAGAGAAFWAVRRRKP
jgi:hypothetical protein